MPNTLTMRRLSIVALAPRDHPEPEALRLRLDHAIRGSLSDALREAIGEWFGEGVVRIRRLEVDLTVDAALPPDQVTAQLALAIADGLERARADGERILTFADRSQYLAGFLCDLAAGRAWQRWWFRSFEGLKFLPVSGGLRTALLANPAEGLAALLALPRAALGDVLAKLEARDRARVLDGFAAAGRTAIASERIVAALAAARAEPTASPASALAIFVDAVRAERSCAGPQLAGLAVALEALDRILAAQPASAAAAILRRINAGETLVAASADAMALAPLLLLPALPRQALSATAAVRRGIAKTAAQTAAPPPARALQHTPFGGLFLLLPSLDFGAIERVIGDVTAPTEVPLAPLVGLLAVAACAGRPQIADVVHDPVWKNVFGLPPSLGAADLKPVLAPVAPATWRALKALGEETAGRKDRRFLLPPQALLGRRLAIQAIAGLARATLSRFARRLPGFASSSPPFLYRNLLAVGAAVETRPDGLSAVLDRPPLDVLLSISGIGDADIAGPGGIRIRQRRRRLA